MSDRLFDPINEPSMETREPIAGEGTLEIEYEIGNNHKEAWQDTFLIKATIFYKYWSVDVEGVAAEYQIIGSANYLPNDFEQLVKDYLLELPELSKQSIYNLKEITPKS